jgi:pimeloyl-ACP methyl ester carboxylesterase
MSIELRFVMELRVELGPVLEVGSTPRGFRRVIPIIGGSFEGPQLRGVVLLHGFSSSARAMDRVAGAFADRYRVLALDHRGHGESDWDPRARYVLDVVATDR